MFHAGMRKKIHYVCEVVCFVKANWTGSDLRLLRWRTTLRSMQKCRMEAQGHVARKHRIDGNGIASQITSFMSNEEEGQTIREFDILLMFYLDRRSSALRDRLLRQAKRPEEVLAIRQALP